MVKVILLFALELLNIDGIWQLVHNILESAEGCEDYEFNCGDGRCIHGLSVCDNNYDCLTGTDELDW